jgi:hypothetical protein
MNPPSGIVRLSVDRAGALLRCGLIALLKTVKPQGQAAILRIGIRLDHRHSIELIESPVQFRKEGCNDFRRVRNDSQSARRVAAIERHVR